jgi:hypothetical protein
MTAWLAARMPARCPAHAPEVKLPGDEAVERTRARTGWQKHYGHGMAITKLFQEDFLEIEHDDENRWIYADWKGYQTEKSIKQGIDLIIELMPRCQTFHILNDNTNTLGIWIGVAAWLISDALPRARIAGLKSFAHVYGGSRFSRISAEAALFLLGSNTSYINAFDDIEEAKKWLRERS